MPCMALECIYFAVIVKNKPMMSVLVKYCLHVFFVWFWLFLH